MTDVDWCTVTAAAAVIVVVAAAVHFSGVFSLVGSTTTSMENCDGSIDRNEYSATCSGIGNFQTAPITFTVPDQSYKGGPMHSQAGPWRQQWVSDYLTTRTELSSDDFTTQCRDGQKMGRVVTICTFTEEQRDIVHDELSVGLEVKNNDDREDWTGTQYALRVGVDAKVQDIVERDGACTATVTDRDTGETFEVDGEFRIGGNGILCGVDPGQSVELTKSPSVSWTIEPDFRLDSDGDGVVDSEDECPETAGVEPFDGCPDSDGDGVPDDEDACPETGDQGNGLTDDGCPLQDTDGDGVTDAVDACPDTAGSKDSGCPTVIKRIQLFFAGVWNEVTGTV